MKKYNISEQFKQISWFTPPLNRLTMLLAKMVLKPPKGFLKTKEASVAEVKIDGYNKGKIQLFVIAPKGNNTTNCLVYFHGGGFVYEAFYYHYLYALRYAKECNCKVIFVNYRLLPKYNYPYPHQDCFNAYKWVINNADKLKIDINNIGVAGDSAGGNLAAAVCLLARDNNIIMPKFQLLIYPFLDTTLTSESAKKYTDTPVWNSSLSKKLSKKYFPKQDSLNLQYLSPVTVKDLSNLPPAYIETAEFDSLRDDGINYANKLAKNGIEVELNNTIGTIHGYDMIVDAPITQDSLKKRIEYINKMFKNK